MRFVIHGASSNDEVKCLACLVVHRAMFHYRFPNALVVLLHHLPPHRPNDGTGGFVGIGAAVLDLTVGDILGD